MSLNATDIHKSYGANAALRGVSLSVAPGQVHGLVGANGAGKSTLVKVLSGAVKPDHGHLTVGTWSGSSLKPRHAQRLGLATIHQDPALAPTLGLVENLVLGHEATHAGVFLASGAQRRKALACLLRVGLTKPVTTRAGDLSPADQQMLEIAKALMLEAHTVIMDEPTAALGDDERHRLFATVRDLRSSGVGVVYISHHLDEVLDLCDVVTVMRDGQVVAHRPVQGLDEDQLVDAMIGHHLTEIDSAGRTPGEVVLRASGVSQHSGLRDVTFELRAGEVLGVTGLVGSGRSRLARVLFGIEPYTDGQLELFGKPYRPRSPADAIRGGIGFVSEDRKRDALLMHLSAAKNITLLGLPTILRAFLNLRRESVVATQWVDRLGIHPRSVRTSPAHLSGGNQQKLVLARCINGGAQILILDEPGQGVDVGAREQILHVVHELTERGVAVLMISQEVEELRPIADRVLVMRKGRIAGELARSEIHDASVIPLAMGVSPRTA